MNHTILNELANATSNITILNKLANATSNITILNELANATSNNADIALDAIRTYVENNPYTAAAVSFASALGIAGATYSIYRSTQKSEDVKAEHTTRLNTVLTELKTQKIQKNAAAKKIQQFYRKNKKSKSTFQKLSLFIKNGVKSMIKSLSKFGRFAFKTLPSRVYNTLFRKSAQQKHSQQYSNVMLELKHGKSEQATEFKPALKELEKESKGTRKVRFDDQDLNKTVVPEPRAGA